MKSTLTWLLWVCLGAISGYALHFLLDLNLWILMTIGVILGSTIGITINIHREEDFEMYDFYKEEDPEDSGK